MAHRDRLDELHRRYSRTCPLRAGPADVMSDRPPRPLEVVLRTGAAIGMCDPTRPILNMWLSRNAQSLGTRLLRTCGCCGPSVPSTDRPAPTDPHGPVSPLLQQVLLCLRSMDPMARQLLLMREVDGYACQGVGIVTAVNFCRRGRRWSMASDDVRDSWRAMRK